MTTVSVIEHELAAVQAYSVWVRHDWRGQPGIQSLAVMSLGLVGECGEALEELRAGPGNAAKLELGDALYYWSRLVDAFGLPAKALWPSQPPEDAGATLDLLVCAARLAETLKKCIRDEVNPLIPAAPRKAVLVKDLVAVATALRQHVLQNGWVVAEVLDLNKEKLIARRALTRSTLTTPKARHAFTEPR